MRPRSIVAFSLAALLGLGAAAHADFDPTGKKKPKPKPPVTGPVVPKPPGPAASGSTSASAEPTETVKKDPIKKAVIIAMARPGESGPVMKLAQLYRERDGKLDTGIGEWKAKAADASLSVDDRWAAQVTYAGLLKADKRDKEAATAYEAAIAQKPDKPVAILALARLKQDAGDAKGAYAQYEKALPLQKDKTEREATLRALMEISVDTKDSASAKKWHQELVKANGDSMTVRAELARYYFRKGQYDLAEKEYEEVVGAASGDNRTLPSALLDLGQCQIKLQKYADAVKTLKKGIAVAGAEAGVRPRLLNAMADAYRAQNKIEDFVAELEKENPQDADRQELLGKLAAEFDAEKSIKWLTKALGSLPTHTDSRLLLIRLLKEQSNLDEALKQYDLLIQYAKGQPQFVFDVCDLLIGRGERPKALARLKTLEANAGGDPDVLGRLAAYYSQIGEDKLALALMERLAAQAGDDPEYLVDLGDYYFQRNNTAKAKEIWKKLLVLVKPKVKGLLALAEVYMAHDLPEDAMELYRQALDVAPSDVMVQKGYASALEATHRLGEAQGIWESILKRNDVDKGTRREARRHLVLLWTASKKLDQQVKPLAEAFKGPPVDLESGRLLAEVQLRLRRLADAEKTLREIIVTAPGDVDARLVLESVLIQQGNVAAAIKVLEELVKADPSMQRAYYTRLAQYALQIYRDEDALKYAAAAVDLSPEDADGHKKLAEMYRSQQDFPKAVKEFRLALQHNGKLWAVYFELAELLLAQGEEVEADVLYRRVMRGCNDDELVANAIRLSAAINQKRGTLEVLEQELLPIALSHPNKAVYRRLLVDIYANLTRPLVASMRAGRQPEAGIAQGKLVRIGARGVQPLIDALSDSDVAQQRTAIEILAFVENRSAALPLFAFATGVTGTPGATGTIGAASTTPMPYAAAYAMPYAAATVDRGLRARAMIAAGALREPQLLQKYEDYLFPKGGVTPKDEIAIAAAWGVARMLSEPKSFAVAKGGGAAEAKKARELILRIVEAPEMLPNEMRVFGVIALGRTHEKIYVEKLEAFLKRGDAGWAGRAAALWSLGEIGDPSARPVVSAQLEGSTDASVRQAAMLSLVRLSLAGRAKPDAKAARAPLTGGAGGAGGASSVALPTDVPIATFADAALDPVPRLRRASAIALAALATGEFRGVSEPLPVPEGSLNADGAIAALIPTAYTPADFATALVTHEKALASAVSTALQTSKERSVVALDAMLSRPDGWGLGVFTETSAIGAAGVSGAPGGAGAAGASAKGEIPKAALDAAARIADAAEPFVLGLVHHPELSVQLRAVRWLGRRDTQAAREALVDALTDASPEVQRLAIEMLSVRGDAASVPALAGVLASHKQWSMRADAAHALGEIGKRDAKAAVEAPLIKAASGPSADAYAFVREAALRALAHSGRAATATLEKAAKDDPEPRVREAAAGLLAPTAPSAPTTPTAPIPAPIPPITPPTSGPTTRP
jgi:tetratricopeptide (TPR) repeat protein/HEAT repeat protein